MYIVSFHDSTRSTYIHEYSSLWTLLIIGCLLENIPCAAVAALQLWMADLNPQTLSNAIEWVYTAFFCSSSV